MATENQQDTGAASSEGGQKSPTSSTQNSGPKLEYKDGSVFMDGKKMVRESDLIAAKQSLESAAEKAQTTHNEAIDAIKLELSAEQKKVAELNAELQKSQSALGQGATDDVARIKQELDDAKKKVETMTAQIGQSLELKRRLIITQYPGVSAESLANKTMQELDSFEEALKAVASSRGGGIGAYAIGGGLGQPMPLSDIDRAKKILESTPIRGVREPEPANK